MMKTILAIETSCDETAVAILRDRELLASEVASQVAQHRQFGGVVPEVASRNHLAHLPNLLNAVLTEARLGITDIAAFAATSGPGLASSLLVGNSAAKGLAIGARKPFLAVNHLEGHLLSPFFRRDAIEPNISLVVSGGHTLLAQVRGIGDYIIIGRTLDDAAGEAFDKVAKLLGLNYPGGPEIESRARSGNAMRFDLPRSMLDSGDLNFSFSGLKTAVRYLLPNIGVIPSRADNASPARTEGSCDGIKDIREIPRFDGDDQLLADLCASFQQAVIDVLREKSLSAVRQTKLNRLTLSGGVGCNLALRKTLQEACDRSGIELLVAEPWLCTDNAVMIAFAAMQRLKAWKGISDLTDEIDPNLALTLDQYSRSSR
jgi:N6-L-threonylcarbamoyladenine synthase